MCSLEGDVVLYDIETTPLTLGEIMARIAEMKNDPAYAGYEIFLDGDRKAIVARPRQ